MPRQFGLPLEIWLVMHGKLRASPRLRAMFDNLGGALSMYTDAKRAGWNVWPGTKQTRPPSCAHVRFWRHKVSVTTKFGHSTVGGKYETGKLNSRPENIRRVADDSLRRLKVDALSAR